MKRLLLALLLISPVSFADWGDVYYCQMTNFSEVTLSGEKRDGKLERFTFKLDRQQNGMVFESNDFFSRKVYTLTKSEYPFSPEFWSASNEYGVSYLLNGKLLHVRHGSSGIISISADCDKF